MTDVVEREIKVKLTIDPEAFLNTLLKEGYTYEGEEIHEDIYLNGENKDFRKTDEALRLRLVNGRAELTYKGPRLGTKSKSREEVTVTLDDKNGMLKILEKLGYRAVFTIKKRRKLLKKNGFTVCIDSVEDLGDFLEIEGINVSEDELMNFFNNFREKFKIKGDIIYKSYLEMRVGKS
ncbi:class IV adenylate cyclase [Metallosphaera tengchongensis]|uniref:Class IV adenylate cyclase n=1 Tax=Metallosphaera tengchongensis TaxID=1532350 RepID=A0A6N0NWX2_9CREN|nr:class IV adenylate cyclase [Metallosphaera tengchongensis]QKQ99857.1 class IV adenylate cyclase [Metallosphaera tengchongensis]